MYKKYPLFQGISAMLGKKYPDISYQNLGREPKAFNAVSDYMNRPWYGFRSGIYFAN